MPCPSHMYHFMWLHLIGPDRKFQSPHATITPASRNSLAFCVSQTHSMNIWFNDFAVSPHFVVATDGWLLPAALSPCQPLAITHRRSHTHTQTMPSQVHFSNIVITQPQRPLFRCTNHLDYFIYESRHRHQQLQWAITIVQWTAFRVWLLWRYSCDPTCFRSAAQSSTEKRICSWSDAMRQ